MLFLNPAYLASLFGFRISALFMDELEAVATV